MSWKTVNLNEACELITDGTHYTPKNIEKGVPFLTVKDMDSYDGLDFENCSFISPHDYQQAAAGNSAPHFDDVLFSKDGTVGKVHVVKTNNEFAVLSSIAILRPKKNILDSSYLGFALKSPSILNDALSRKTGSAIRRIVLTDLKKVAIPLPPLPEQKRIAAILDKADELKRKREAAIAKLDQLAQSVFVEMFGDVAINDKKWSVGKIGDLLESATYGTSEKSSQVGNYAVLRMNNITKTGAMDLTDLKYMDLEENQLDRFLVKTGDVLFNRTNSAELVGKTAIYRSNVPVAYAGYLIRLRVNQKADPEFLASYLNTPYAKKELRSMCKSIIGMANINAKEIQAMRIPMPPIALQEEFAKYINKIEHQKVATNAALTKQNNLFASLQHQAFAGQL